MQSSTFLFYVVTYHFHLLVDSIRKSMFAYEDFSKRGNLLTKKMMLHGYNESRLKSSFCKFYGRYNDLVCDYKLSQAHMLNDLLHTICWTVISTLTLTTGNPENLISTKGARRVWRVSRGCLLLLDTWSYLRICRRSVLPYTRFFNCLLNYDYVLHNVNFAILYVPWLKNVYGLGVGISTVFVILGHFLCQGDRTTSYGHDLYTIRCSLMFLDTRNKDMCGLGWRHQRFSRY
jgi:hypothetical protein